MLSSEGNEDGEKTTIRSNQQKRNFARAAHFFCIFLCRCFARLQHETSRNFVVTCFMEEMSNVFLFTLFSPPLIFTQVAASISHFLTAATKFSCCTYKKCLLCFFISRSSPLSLFFQLSFGGLSPTSSFSLSFSFSIFQICGHDSEINLSLILQTTRVQTQFLLSVFFFIDS